MLDVHPALLIPAIVVLSQFGLIWLFAAAPVVAILRDVTRPSSPAASGDPPAPANVRVSDRTDSASAVQRRAPSVYLPRRRP